MLNFILLILKICKDKAMNNFPYGQKELDYLAAADPKLAAVIKAVGKIERQVRPDVFASLISSIISQQISGKAAITIRSRVETLAGGSLAPLALQKLSADSLSACGLSGTKVRYIQTAAQAAIDGTIDFAALSNLSDEEVIAKLTTLPGVGRWTAEMLLIFSLQRPDIISYHDFGIRKGMELLYNIDKLSKKEFLRISAAYHPYATMASFYLWYVGNNNWQP